MAAKSSLTGGQHWSLAPSSQCLQGQVHPSRLPAVHARSTLDKIVCAFLLCTGQFAESAQGEIKFPEISGKVLEKVVQYFYYKLKHTGNTGTPLPEFKIEPEHALELLMAANFLDC